MSARGKSFILCLYMKTISAKQSTLRLICTMWPTQNNLKTFNPIQSFNLMSRFRSRTRRNFVNSLLLFIIIIIYLFIIIIKNKYWTFLDCNSAIQCTNFNFPLLLLDGQDVNTTTSTGCKLWTFPMYGISVRSSFSFSFLAPTPSNVISGSEEVHIQERNFNWLR